MRNSIKILAITSRAEADFVDLTYSHGQLGEASSFDIKVVNENAAIYEIYNKFQPHIIIMDPLYLDEIYEIRSIIPMLPIPEVINSAFGYKIIQSLLDMNTDPSFSIITSIYNTNPLKITRLYSSLKRQILSNWEWIIYDDSTNDDAYNFISHLMKYEPRIKLYKSAKHLGNIGKVKHIAFSLAQNDYLVEVDHDDELTDDCLMNISDAFYKYPDAEFAYGHTCETYDEKSKFINYGQDWAFGFGDVRSVWYNGEYYEYNITPDINSKTIRHIVSAPNHVRVWKRNFYQKIGGHNSNLHVADDYELLVRTFLATKMIKIDAMTYIQYMDSNKTNAQYRRNSEIQRLVNAIANKYNEQIHNRFLELNINDFCYNNSNYDLWMTNPDIVDIANYIYKPS